MVSRWCATYFWKAFDEGYNFALNLISIENLHKKLWASKVAGIPISRLQLGSLRTKWYLNAGLMVRHKEYYKGKVVFSPNLGHGESCESMFVRGSSVHQKNSNYALTNLFGLFRSVWVMNFLVTFPSPNLRAPTCLSTPKVLQTKERVPTPYPFIVFTHWIHNLVH
jgi:hypothetical protein